MVSPQDDPMLLIWEKVSAIEPKISSLEPDGARCIIWRNRNDLDYLYDSGFVDTDRFKKEQWIDAFQEALRPDGSYRLTRDQWLAKRPFRYIGPTNPPFDPLTLKEGEWDKEEFEKVFRYNILPSTTISEEQFRKGFEKARKTAFSHGKVVINKPFKFSLKQALLLYPSPRRVREINVAEQREKLTALTAPVSAKTATAAKTAPSQFSSGPSKEQSIQDQLNRLLRK